MDNSKWDIAKLLTAFGAGAGGFGALLGAIRRFRFGDRKQRQRDALRSACMEVAREVVVEVMNGERKAMLDRLDALENRQLEQGISNTRHFDRIQSGIESLRRLVLNQSANASQPAAHKEPIT